MDLGGDVGLYGECPFVAQIEEGFADPAHHALSLSRVGVLDLSIFVFSAVLDVNVLDEGKGRLVEIPGFFRRMALAQRIARIEDPPQPEQFSCTMTTSPPAAIRASSFMRRIASLRHSPSLRPSLG
jgi:hypothetical protein